MIGASLSGDLLEGSHIVRMAYLDEAGLSNPHHEPFVVVAGPLVNADKQWLALERHLEALADRYAPPDKRAGFSFHATDLFSGGGAFPRERYPKEDRWKILDELVATIRLFKLPIAAGWVERENLAAAYPTHNAVELTTGAQAVAFAICTHAIDLYMRQGDGIEPDEVASLVVENNNDARKLIKDVHKFNRNPKNAAALTGMGFQKLVLTKIIGTPHFEEKGDSSPLQLADVCAFVVKRHLMRKPESDRFYLPLEPGMILVEKTQAS